MSEDVPSPSTIAYRVYTKANDRIITSEQIEDAILEYPDSRFPQPDFSSFHSEAYSRYRASAERMGAIIAQTQPADVVVTLLVDHSGSLRGDIACLTASTAGAISLCLTCAGTRHEVLGFTTRSWHGGMSRGRWLKMGGAYPGRLCDLLHVVHRPFDASRELSEEAMQRMTLPGFCKENIDGEAIEWASERLRSAKATRRVLIVLSDGAPVDDATLLANYPEILTNHLEAVTEAIVREGVIELYAISPSPEHWLPWYYPQYAVVTDNCEIADIALPVLAAVVSHSVMAPAAGQLPERRVFAPQTDSEASFELP